MRTEQAVAKPAPPHPAVSTARVAATALLALATALLTGAAAANGAQLPPPLIPHEAEYRVSRGPLTLGRSVTTLEPADGGWEYRTVVTATGAARLLVSGQAVERTLLESDGTALRTLRYQHTRPNDGGSAHVEFAWDHHQAYIDNDDGEMVVPLAADQHDPHGAILTVVIALARDGSVPSFAILDDDGDITRLNFHTEAGGTIRVPYGEFDTVKVTRIREDRDRQLIAWFAPELDWLPVRITQIDEGSTVARMDLRRLDGDSGSSTIQRRPGDRR